MEFSFPLALTVISLNLAAIAINYLLQQVDLAKGLIPARDSIIFETKHRFLHWQDFYAQKWGDTIFLNGMFVAFWHLLIFTEAMSFRFMLVFWLIMVVDAVLFQKMCINDKNHKHDWGFPTTGKMNKAGFFHSLYHGFGIATALICLWHIFITGELSGWALWSFWIGVAGYVVCFIADIRAGHFAKLKKIS